MRRGALQQANKDIDDGTAREVAAIKAEMGPQLAEARAETTRARETLQEWKGPPREDSCYCAFNMCLTVSSQDEMNSEAKARAERRRHYEEDLGMSTFEAIKRVTREDQERRELENERYRLKCREKYRAYLSNKGSADYQATLARLDEQLRQLDARDAALQQAHERRIAAVEAERKRRLADHAEMLRLVEERLARDRKAREDELDKSRQRCRDAATFKANPCLCRALLDLPQSTAKGGVCER